MPSLPDPIAERDRSSGITQKKMLRDQSERGMELNMVFPTYHLLSNDSWMKMMSWCGDSSFYGWLQHIYDKHEKLKNLWGSCWNNPRRLGTICRSFWDTEEWKQLKVEFNFEETTHKIDMEVLQQSQQLWL